MQISRLAREAKSESLKPTSPGSRGRNFNSDESPLSQQTRMYCSAIAQLLTDSLSAEQTKNKLVSSIREEIKGLREDVKQQLNELTKSLTVVKENDQRITHVLSTDEERRSRSVHDEDYLFENQKSKSR